MDNRNSGPMNSMQNVGDPQGSTGSDNNSGSYTKDTTVRFPGEEPTPSGRTATSGLEGNPTSVALGTPTPARNSGAGNGPSAAMAMHNATVPTVL